MTKGKKYGVEGGTVVLTGLAVWYFWPQIASGFGWGSGSGGNPNGSSDPNANKPNDNNGSGAGGKGNGSNANTAGDEDNSNVVDDVIVYKEIKGVPMSIDTFASVYKGLFYSLSQGTGILPEVAFSQAIAESSDSNGNFGKGITAVNANNYFGIQADPSWNGEVYVATDSAGTPGVHWRAYASPEDSIKDYYKFMQDNGYADAAKGSNSASDQIDAIAARGYAGRGNTTYANFLKQIVPRAKNILALSQDTYQSSKSDVGSWLGVALAVGIGVTLLGGESFIKVSKK
jgi:hypothetical protein